MDNALESAGVLAEELTLLHSAVASMPLFPMKPTRASLSVMIHILSAAYVVITLHISNTLLCPISSYNRPLTAVPILAANHGELCTRATLAPLPTVPLGPFVCQRGRRPDNSDGIGDYNKRTITYRANRRFVLSSASGKGPSRREANRSTWGSRHTAFFIVAVPWDDIKQEYYQQRDLIWLAIKLNLPS